MDKTPIIKQLNDFILRDKYEAYNGPDGSDKEVVDEINSKSNLCAGQLIELYNLTEQSIPQMEALLADLLDEFINSGYDTEDREFSAEIVAVLAGIVGIDSGTLVPPSIGHSRNDFEKWAAKMSEELRLLPKIKANCIECGHPFELQVWKQNEEEKGGWFIITCDACNNIDYFAVPDQVESYGMRGFNWLEFLDNVHFTKQDVAYRVEQLIRKSDH